MRNSTNSALSSSKTTLMLNLSFVYTISANIISKEIYSSRVISDSLKRSVPKFTDSVLIIPIYDFNIGIKKSGNSEKLSVLNSLLQTPAKVKIKSVIIDKPFSCFPILSTNPFEYKIRTIEHD